MSERDPLDDLLRRAFAADRARTPPAQVMERVMAQIRRRQRLRALTLAAALICGLLLLASSIEPAMTVLLDVASQSVPAQRPDDTLAFVLLAVAGAAWLMLMDFEWS